MQPDGSALLRIEDHLGNLGCASDRLTSAVKHDQLAAEELRDAVLHARLEHNMTWDQVATFLGITRQSVQKRYALAEQLAEAEEEGISL